MTDTLYVEDILVAQTEHWPYEQPWWTNEDGFSTEYRTVVCACDNGVKAHPWGEGIHHG